MKFKSIILCAALGLAAIIPTVSAQTSNPLINFLNPTNTFLEAKELNLTFDAGFQRVRGASAGLGARFWISDSQGAAISYEAFPRADRGEWHIAYGYRTAYGKMELAMLVGMAEDVDADDMLFRPYFEVDAIYQINKTLGAGIKTQITDRERPFIGLLVTYKLWK